MILPYYVIERSVEKYKNYQQKLKRQVKHNTKLHFHSFLNIKE